MGHRNSGMLLNVSTKFPVEKDHPVKNCPGLLCIPFFVSLRNFSRFRRVSPHFAETQRKECTRVQGSLLQFISRYSLEIRVLIIPYKPFNIWHPIAWASSDLYTMPNNHPNPALLTSILDESEDRGPYYASFSQKRRNVTFVPLEITHFCHRRPTFQIQQSHSKGMVPPALLPGLTFTSCPLNGQS